MREHLKKTGKGFVVYLEYDYIPSEEYDAIDGVLTHCGHDDADAMRFIGRWITRMAECETVDDALDFAEDVNYRCPSYMRPADMVAWVEVNPVEVARQARRDGDYQYPLQVASMFNI